MEFDASRPIWLQLREEFSRRIVVGIWAPGEQIPGVRELAAELGVNPNTVQRTLADMERDSLVRSERAVGRFVTHDIARIAHLRRDHASVAAAEFIQRARGFGLSQSEAISLITERWQQ